MTSFTNWFVAQQLQNMGWPRSKGLFPKVHYVEAMVLDVVVGKLPNCEATYIPQAGLFWLFERRVRCRIR